MSKSNSLSNHLPSQPLTSPDLSWNDQGLPVSQQFDDPYFSVEDGLNESRYVFLQHNGLPQRWQNWQGEFDIIETGFGTGLNFLMTWQSFAQSRQESGNEDIWLHYTSIEKFPLNKQELRQAMALWSELNEFTELLLQQYPLAVNGFHHLIWPEHKIQLTLIFNDVHDALPQINGPVHAWYLDGFAPSKNPEMWTDNLFRQMRRINALQPHQESTIATFTAAGIVRRGIKGAGFNIKKVPGFGRKREMLAGVYQQFNGPELPPFKWHKPWLVNTNSHDNQPPKKVTIIGAGLAGCTTARALAERGIEVQIIDRKGIAQAASGNPQGGLYVKLAAGDNAVHTDFYLAAYQSSLRHVVNVLGQGKNEGSWKNCGVLQLAYDEKEARRQQKFLQAHSYPPELVYEVTADQASALAGCPQSSGGLFFPQAGWVSPAEFCQQLIDHPAISFEKRDIQALAKNTDGWTLTNDAGDTLVCQHLVIASAFEAKQLLPKAYLPVKRIRGQLSILDTSLVPDINTVLCARSYMAPSKLGLTCLGATYNLNDDDENVRASDHQTNLGHLSDFGPAWEDIDHDAVVQGRVGFRCTTPDYLPMVGRLPMTDAFIEAFRPMVKNAKHIPAVEAPQLPDLWLNIGHGSRGLASAPLCAQLLAAQITGGALPLSAAIQEALWPGRFLLRDMQRRKIGG